VWFALRDSRKAVFRFDHALTPDALAASVDGLFDLVMAHAANGGKEDVLSRAPSFMSQSAWAPVVMRFDGETNRWRSWTLDRHGQVAPVDEGP
jgi:hypothetical protein